MFFVVVHFVMMFEIDMDKNLIDQLNDDNNIVEEYEYVENMMLYHQQIMKNAKNKKTNSYIFFLKFIFIYISYTGTRHLNCWNENIQF